MSNAYHINIRLSTETGSSIVMWLGILIKSAVISNKINKIFILNRMTATSNLLY